MFGGCDAMKDLEYAEMQLEAQVTRDKLALAPAVHSLGLRPATM